MYLILKDTEGDYRQVDYGCYGEDMNDIKKEEWQDWNIALQDFTAANVDLTAVEKVYIGFGIRGNPNPGGTPGGSGFVYFDDIRLCPPRCLTWLGQLEGDLNDDCVVDVKDLRIMGADWLQRDLVDATAPNRDGLLVEYTFDTDCSDTSGNERHGIPAMNAFVSDGNLVLNADYESYVDIPLGAANPFDGLTDCTLQMTFSSNGGRQILLTSSAMFSKQDEHPMIFFTQKDEEESNWCPTLHFWFDGGGRDGCIVNFNDGMMHTVVFTYDADTFALRYYSDGYEDGMYEVRHWMPVAYPGFPQHVVRIGDSASYSMKRDMETSNFIGEIDSVRIYDYMLSELEVMYVSTDGTGIRQIPSRANLYNEEPPGSRAVNFRDYAKLADAWLEKSYWP